MTLSPSRLVVEGLDVVVDSAWVVREAKLSLGEGETLALLGGPGAGKTALLEAIACQRGSTRGVVQLDGHDLTGLDPVSRLALGLAHAHQRPVLFPGLTVGQHLTLGHVAGRTSPAAARARTIRLVPELADLERQKVDRLDRAQARLVDVGRALMSAPSVLLLDEPSLDLDPLRVEDLLVALTDEGIAVLLAERFPYPALREAGRACLMVSGRILAEGPSLLVADDPRLVQACTGELSL